MNIIQRNSFVYYTIQQRTTSESPWLELDKPLKKVTKDNNWHNSNLGWLDKWDGQSIKNKVESDEKYDVWCKTHGTGYWSFKYTKLGMEQLQKMDRQVKFNYCDGYGKVHQIVRHEFRIVKIIHTPDEIEIVK